MPVLIDKIKTKTGKDKYLKELLCEKCCIELKLGEDE